MITAVTQTLKSILVEASPLIRNVEIDLNHPQMRQNVKPALSLYFYALSKTNRNLQDDLTRQLNAELYIVDWYDLSFVIIPWDRTVLGQWHLLSEALKSLIPHQLISQEKLAPELKGFGDLPLEIATSVPDKTKLEQALAINFNPALYITIQTPFVIKKISTLV